MEPFNFENSNGGFIFLQWGQKDKQQVERLKMSNRTGARTQNKAGNGKYRTTFPGHGQASIEQLLQPEREISTCPPYLHLQLELVAALQVREGKKERKTRMDPTLW